MTQNYQISVACENHLNIHTLFANSLINQFYEKTRACDFSAVSPLSLFVHPSVITIIMSQPSPYQNVSCLSFHRYDENRISLIPISGNGKREKQTSDDFGIFPEISLKIRIKNLQITSCNIASRSVSHPDVSPNCKKMENQGF